MSSPDMEQIKSPQLEDGHIRIANELYDAILSFGFTGRQIHVLLAIVRKTYGYSKKSDDLSASQIGTICGISRNHVTSTLNQLAEMRVISKSPGVYGSFISVNKNYRAWAKPKPEDGAPAIITPKPKTPSPESVRSPELGQGVPKEYLASPESVQVDSPESVHTTDNLPTANKQQKRPCANADAFSQFWSAYPKRKSKGQAEKAFEKLNPDEQLMTKILSGIEQATKSRDWKKDDGQFIPYPASWLNAKGWEDELTKTTSARPKNGAMPNGNFANQDYRAGAAADGSF